MSSRPSCVKRSLRHKVAKRDGWKCHYCARPLHRGSATLDHVVPLALGGSWRQENLRLACRKCNTQKADKSPHVFWALMMQGAA